MPALLALLISVGAAGCAETSDQGAPPTGRPTSTGDSRALLDKLTVAAAGSMRGYSREHFPHWRSAGKNCDVRDTVLQRDGEGIKLTGCNVVGGHWTSVYDKRELTDPADVDIDHMVPLANAWRTGAAAWTDEQRSAFANDLTRPQLIAVSASSNRSKGDQDPSQWRPPRQEYWCTYAQSWITVKAYWQLSVTSEEKSALAEMLGTC